MSLCHASNLLIIIRATWIVAQLFTCLLFGCWPGMSRETDDDHLRRSRGRKRPRWLMMYQPSGDNSSRVPIFIGFTILIRLSSSSWSSSSSSSSSTLVVHWDGWRCSWCRWRDDKFALLHYKRSSTLLSTEQQTSKQHPCLLLRDHHHHHHHPRAEQHKKATTYWLSAFVRMNISLNYGRPTN